MADNGGGDGDGGLSELSKIAGIVVGVGFAIGLLFNLGFFLVLDLRLFPLLTYQDHLEALAIFTPFAILPMFIVVAVRRSAAWRRRASFAAGMLAIITLVGWTERGELPTVAQPWVVWVAFIAAFTMVVYCAAVIVDRGLHINIKAAEAPASDENVTTISAAALGLLVFVTLLGATMAHLYMRPTEFDTQVAVASDGTSPPQLKPAHLVRTIANGVFVEFRDTPAQVTYLRNEAFRSLAEPAKP